MNKAKAKKSFNSRAMRGKPGSEPIEGYRPAPSSFSMEPLPATFSLTGMLGFIITTVLTASGRAPLSWGVAFDIVFALMFLSSMISITPSFSENYGKLH